MELNFKILILLLYLIFGSSNALALTLNKMQVNSKQDEPLNAVIDVIFSKGDKASNLKPAIASRENYEANGLARLPIHADIQIRLEEGANGPKIFLISNEIVKDPFLDLLIQIDSERGRVYKEYTVLLEPPSPKISIEKVIEAKKNDNEKLVKKIDASNKKIEPVKAEQERTKTAEIATEAKQVKKPAIEKEVKGKIVKSVKGKTLYQIARENKPSGVTTEQMVLAIYQNNPKAFAKNNVNTLINNKALQIPPLTYFENHSHLEARKILRDQNIEWKNKLKKKNKPVKQKNIINKDVAKIDRLEKELIEAKKKIEDLSRINIESKNDSNEASNILPKENLEALKEEQSPKEEEQSPKVEINQEKDGDESVFVSSISDINENKIDETEIDIKAKKGLETIHVLLLVLFFVLLFGLFIVISRRKTNERNRTLKSFVDENDLTSRSESPAQTDENYSSDSLLQESNRDDTSQESKKNYPPISDDD